MYVNKASTSPQLKFIVNYIKDQDRRAKQEEEWREKEEQARNEIKAIEVRNNIKRLNLDFGERTSMRQDKYET